MSGLGQNRKSSMRANVFRCSPNNGHSSEFYADRGPYVLLTPGNFHEEGGFRWLGEKQKFYNGPVPKGFILNPGDMLVAMTEQAPGLLGSTFFVPSDAAY